MILTTVHLVIPLLPVMNHLSALPVGIMTTSHYTSAAATWRYRGDVLPGRYYACLA